MEKLTNLSADESSSNQPLGGVYHVVVDLKVKAGENVMLEDVQKKISELGGIEGFYIEKYEQEAESYKTGDSISLTADMTIEKPVYLDTSGNLVVTDKPVAQCVECVGHYNIHLPKGCVGEVNKEASDNMVEVLFTGAMIGIEGLAKQAYIGILTMPYGVLQKYDA